MTSLADSTGVTLDRRADVLARLTTLHQAVFGTSIDLSEEELFGHLMSCRSLLTAEQNEVLQSVYDGMSIANSTGVPLANNVELVGLERIAAAYSTVTLTLTSTEVTTVPAGTQYKTAAGVVFATNTALAFTAAGTDDVAATCTVVGANNAAIAEVNIIVNAVFGISTVTNAAAVTPGRARETDADLKERHTALTNTTGISSAGRIKVAVSEVTGVSDVYIYDNDTGAAVGSVPDGYINVSTIGGADAGIAEAISINKTEGVPTYGATATNYYDTTTKQLKVINHDHAVDTPTHISMTLTTVEGVFPDDGSDQIKAALVAQYDDIEIDDDILYDKLNAAIYSVNGHVASLLKLDTVDPPVDTVDLASSPLIKYSLDIDDIDITVV